MWLPLVQRAVILPVSASPNISGRAAQRDHSFMSNVHSLHHPAPSFDDDAWDDLLNYIEERRVIPIIGPELLKVETESGPMLFYDWLADKLAAKLGVDTAQLPQPYTLNDVVCWFLSARGRREDTYTRIRSLLREITFEPPKALKQLAEITDFDLFVTTTFDSFIEQAINNQRFAGAQSTEVIAYTPNRVADIPSERAELTRPVVYHLLGKCSASPTYVVSDEDMLEFVCALQREHLTPEKLFYELEHSHILLIGSNFSNWLARLFLRMAKRRRLSDPRDVGEVLADNHSGSDDRLMAFLQQVSVRTRVYTGAEHFVDELHRRWMARRKPADVIAFNGNSAPQRVLPPEREMPDNAVFISYAREDLVAVQKIKAAFDAADIKVWFDMERLESGDDFDRKIQKNIARCAFFVPVISNNTERRLEAYFRREWSYALDRTRNMADDAIFILPVAVDAINERDAKVPDKFKAVHITQATGGDINPEFVERLKALLGARS